MQESRAVACLVCILGAVSFHTSCKPHLHETKEGLVDHGDQHSVHQETLKAAQQNNMSGNQVPRPGMVLTHIHTL
jgi:hypothetical protein